MFCILFFKIKKKKKKTIDLNRAQRNQVLSEASRLKVVKCPLGCGVSMKGTWIGSHIENDCENREIQCTNQCGEKVVACMLGNNTNISKKMENILFWL